MFYNFCFKSLYTIFLKMLFSTLITTLYLLKGTKGTGFWHKLLNCLFRGYNESPVGRCHRVDAVHVCQRLRLIHHHRLGSFLAHGLPKRRRRHKDGYRTLSGGHSCSFHGQVSQQFNHFLKLNEILANRMCVLNN